MSGIRVGLGFDIHRLEEGRPCVLGGVELPHPTGPAGHSDGDAVLHAVTDAVTGAAGLDDIGTLFPDDDPRWKGADSRALLRAAVELAADAGWRPGNVDVVIATEGPKIKPHRAAIRASLAELLGLGVDDVNVKGKTLEGMTELAEGRAVTVRGVPDDPRPARRLGGLIASGVGRAVGERTAAVVWSSSRGAARGSRCVSPCPAAPRTRGGSAAPDPRRTRHAPSGRGVPPEGGGGAGPHPP